jgi:hypothetical protein
MWNKNNKNYPSEGLDCEKLDCEGLDCEGFDCEGFDCEGFDCEEFNYVGVRFEARGEGIDERQFFLGDDLGRNARRSAKWDFNSIDDKLHVCMCVCVRARVYA